MSDDDRNTDSAIAIIVAATLILIGFVVYKIASEYADNPEPRPVSLEQPEPSMTPGFVERRQPRASRGRMAKPAQRPLHAHKKPTAHKAVGFSALELRIAECESGGSYTAENPSSSASGRWQVIDGTWGNYGGYSHASDAPPRVQDAWARAYFDKNGYSAWRASRSCWA